MIRLLLFLSCSSLLAKGPANDNFANAHELTGEKYPYMHQGSLTDKLDRFRATREEGEPDHAGQQCFGSVWYTWVADKSRKMRIMVGNPKSAMKIVVAAYQGTRVNDLTLLHRYSNFAFPAFSRISTEPFANTAFIEFNAKEGERYYFAIDTETESYDHFRLLLHTYDNNFNPQLELLPAGSEWEYLLARNQNGEPVDPKSLDSNFYHTWMFPKRYEGPAFLKGRAPIGYGQMIFGKVRSNLGGRRGYLPPEGKRHTAYLRTSFTPPIDVTTIGLEGVFDDAAIIYLNGKEILRLNIAEDKNPQDWTSEAKSDRRDKWNTTEYYIHTETVDGLTLPGGKPVDLSISLHNHGSDEDLGMDLRVYALFSDNLNQ